MDEITHVVSFIVQPQHSFGEKIPSAPLDGALKYRASNEVIATPLASKSVLTSDGNDVAVLLPWSQLLLDLG